MAHSLLQSFDPFATHPFTNGSGLVPQPPKPSAYPVPIPSAHLRSSYTSPTTHSPLSTSVSSTSSLSDSSSAPTLHSPKPTRPIPSSPRQIFVPYKRYTSSPDLVLKKKVPTPAK